MKNSKRMANTDVTTFEVTVPFLAALGEVRRLLGPPLIATGSLLHTEANNPFYYTKTVPNTSQNHWHDVFWFIVSKRGTFQKHVFHGQIFKQIDIFSVLYLQLHFKFRKLLLQHLSLWSRIRITLIQSRL